MKPNDHLANHRKPWSPEDLASLEKIYPDTDNATLGRVFRRSEASIQNQAVIHGWLKSDAYMSTKPGCFKPGLTPGTKALTTAPRAVNAPASKKAMCQPAGSRSEPSASRKMAT